MYLSTSSSLYIIVITYRFIFAICIIYTIRHHTNSTSHPLVGGHSHVVMKVAVDFALDMPGVHSALEQRYHPHEEEEDDSDEDMWSPLQDDSPYPHLAISMKA